MSDNKQTPSTLSKDVVAGFIDANRTTGKLPPKESWRLHPEGEPKHCLIQILVFCNVQNFFCPDIGEEPINAAVLTDKEFEDLNLRVYALQAHQNNVIKIHGFMLHCTIREFMGVEFSDTHTHGLTETFPDLIKYEIRSTGPQSVGPTILTMVVNQLLRKGKPVNESIEPFELVDDEGDKFKYKIELDFDEIANCPIFEVVPADTTMRDLYRANIADFDKRCNENIANTIAKASGK